MADFAFKTFERDDLIQNKELTFKSPVGRGGRLALLGSLFSIIVSILFLPALTKADSTQKPPDRSQCEKAGLLDAWNLGEKQSEDLSIWDQEIKQGETQVMPLESRSCATFRPKKDGPETPAETKDKLSCCHAGFQPKRLKVAARINAKNHNPRATQNAELKAWNRGREFGGSNCIGTCQLDPSQDPTIGGQWGAFEIGAVEAAQCLPQNDETGNAARAIPTEQVAACDEKDAKGTPSGRSPRQGKSRVGSAQTIGTP